VRVEEPVKTTYRGIEVYKLTHWTQGPAMLQALNILENYDLKAMGYNSARYIHTLHQAMSMAFADRDFYYGDPSFPPAEPTRGLLSKAYAKSRFATINWERNDPNVKPGDPYLFQGAKNPFAAELARWTVVPAPDTLRRSGQQDKVSDAGAGRNRPGSRPPVASSRHAYEPGEGVGSREPQRDSSFRASFYAGTTSIQAADSAGWVVSITPSGGWVPAVIAGRTGIGLSQRAQSFVTSAKDAIESPCFLSRCISEIFSSSGQPSSLIPSGLRFALPSFSCKPVEQESFSRSWQIKQ